MARKPDLPCSICGTLLWRHRSSLPDGEATCLPCRRSQPGYKPRRSSAQAHIGTETECARCGRSFVRVIDRQRLCRQPCSPKTSGTSDKAATLAERGYDAAHAKARAEANAAWTPGDPCARCGGPMLEGQPRDLDHTDDRSGYLGLSHASCNRSHTGRLQAVRVPKVCEHCGVSYSTRYLLQRFCSIPCRREASARERADWALKPKTRKLKKERPLRDCPECGALHARLRYCSKACAQQANSRRSSERRQRSRARTVHTYECACCGVACESNKPNARYCSTACAKRATKRRAQGKPERSPVLAPRVDAQRAA